MIAHSTPRPLRRLVASMSIAAAPLAWVALGCASSASEPPRHASQAAHASPAVAPAPSPSPLIHEIERQDDRLSAAFNAHDLAALMALFTRDLEFFHDTGGLQNFAEVEAGFARLFAQGNGIRRERVAGTLRVFPIRDYGAIEIGAHTFCHEEIGPDESGRTDCGTFEFVQIWRQEGESWKIARVVSFGH